MNILLFALGSHGDVHPFVGIGIRLRERGHHVAVAANEFFKPLIDHANLEFIGIGTAEEYTSLAKNADLWHPFRGPQAVFEGTARYLRPMYEVATQFMQRGDVAMAASTLAVGARVAQDRHNIPLATIHLSPAIFQSVEALPVLIPLSYLPRWSPRWLKRGAWGVLNRIVDALMGPAVNELRASVGLPAVKHLIRDYWHSPQCVIGLFPEWYAKPQADWPKQTRLTGFPLFDEPDLSPMSDELIAFLEGGEPPIAFTPGSAMWSAQQFFEQCVESCVRLKRRGVLLTRHRDNIPASLPPGVIHVQYAPFSALLPRCAALVHHGGIGTSAQALASGVPQLVTPFTHDQPDNASRLKSLGVARVLAAAEYTAKRATPLLRELIDNPAIAKSAGEVAGRFIGQDPIGRTCELIELVNRNTPADR